MLDWISVNMFEEPEASAIILVRSIGLSNDWLTVVPGCGTEGDEANNGVLHLQDCCISAVHYGETRRRARVVLSHTTAEDHVRLAATTEGSTVATEGSTVAMKLLEQRIVCLIHESAILKR